MRERALKAGNAHYADASAVPDQIPVFPLAGALLLPGCRLPLNVFEPRYLAMVDHALAGARVIGMIQPDAGANEDGLSGTEPALSVIGCAGRLVSFAETGDGRYLISLEGICRFRCRGEVRTGMPFRQCRIAPLAADFEADDSAGRVDRAALLRAFQAYLEANSLEADWDSIRGAANDVLVNTLSMMAPFGPEEKQALLEAADLKTRAETLVAVTELSLARGGDRSPSSLQ